MNVFRRLLESLGKPGEAVAEPGEHGDHDEGERFG
jgi:hypothetical protein